MTRFYRLFSVAFLIAALGASDVFAKAKLTIIGGVGFSDPTPATPVGGNPGTTLGQQRTNAANRAAEIWGDQLESAIEILIDVSFEPLECDDDGAVLGSAGPRATVSVFPNQPKTGVVYPIALANKFAGQDLAPGSTDILARFNSRIDDANCLGSTNWYYGFDGNNGNDSDFLVVFLHELAHGLGFSSGVRVNVDSSGNLTADSGQFRTSNRPGIYDTLLFDNTTGLPWDQMTSAQRFASINNDQNVVWTGPSVRTAAGMLLGPTPVLRVNEPASIANTYTVGSASFGSTATVAGLTANIAAPEDAVEPFDDTDNDPTTPDIQGTTLDACSAIGNPGALAGRFALVDRGYCAFVQKARNVQAAGAIGILIVDNLVRLSPPPLGGSDPSIRIPVFSLTRPDGQNIRLQLANGVGVTLFADSTRLVGADLTGKVKLYMPSAVAPGSSVSHWDVSAFPNLLMEPFINNDLLPVLDVTLNQMLDIGWTQPIPPPVPTPPTTGRKGLRRGR